MAKIAKLGNSFVGRDGAFGRLVVLLGIVGTVAASGCGRALTISQDAYVNTAMHRGRIAERRTGDPLEVNIVCVYPHDLNKEVNKQLLGDFGITSDIWYKKRPTLGGGEPGKFDLPRNQIYLLIDETDAYGKTVGPRLKGAKEDGKSEIVVRGGIDFIGRVLHDARSVIYVFPKFVDEAGKVLAVPPAIFDPPGDFRRELFVKIGVRDPGGRAEQYIENTTVRHLGK